MNRTIALRIVLGAALLGWSAFAFWTFSFSYSNGFFRYDLPSRLPPFIAAFLAAVAIPISAVVQWRRMRGRRTSPLFAWLVHLFSAAASLIPLIATSAILTRAPEPWHMSGDDAMGVGIDFIILVGLGTASALILAVALAIGRPR